MPQAACFELTIQFWLITLLFQTFLVHIANPNITKLNRYLDQLGMTATFNHKVFCRQALIGGNYALLNTTTFIPNPDYYGALLWNRLMGKKVLAVSHNSSPYLRSYAHCAKHGVSFTICLLKTS